MQLNTQEHIDVMSHFEREMQKSWHSSLRFHREPKDLWPKGHIYQDSVTNDLFLAYRRGYALAKSTYQTHAA